MKTMQPDQKFSRFMFHLKFSKKDEYVHEHELYEVMKSRDLYQTQFGLRSNYQKAMRNIAKDEKQRRYNFENNRKIFVQKMKERREQVDKLRKRLSTSINSLSKTDPAPKKLERQFVPIPQSTVVFKELPAIADSRKETVPSQETPDTQEQVSLPPATPSPSMVATVWSHPVGMSTANGPKDRSRVKAMSAKYLIVGKQSPRTRTAERHCSVGSARGEMRPEIAESLDNEIATQNEDLVNELSALNIEHDNNKNAADEKDSVLNNENGKTTKTPKRIDTSDVKGIHSNPDGTDEFETKTKQGEGGAQESTVLFSDVLPKRHDFKNHDLASQSKTKAWAVKHGIRKSKVHIQKEQDFQRLLIDRPSKWALDHVHQDRDHVQSNILDVRLQDSRRLLNGSFKKKAKQLDHLSEKLNLKQRISLPELDTAPKPMVTLNPGGTTPDGRLILTKADYEDYLSNFRTARKCRLEWTKKKSKNLERQVANFSVDPQLCLRDETCLRASLRTI